MDALSHRLYDRGPVTEWFGNLNCHRSRLNSKTYLFFVLSAIFILFLMTNMIWFLSTQSADAGENTYYVAKNGSDLSPGTEEEPWLTIQKAADTMVAGDTVYVKEGTYIEDITVANSGRPGGLITFKAYESDRVVIDLSGVDEVAFNFNDKDYIRLEGFEFAGGSIAIYNNNGRYTTVGLVISNNYVHDTAEDGIFLRGVNESLVTGNKVINAGAPGYGSCIVIGGAENVIEYNEVSNPGDEDGIKTWGDKTVIRGNYIRWMNGTGHSDGVQIQSGKNIILEENVIENARTQALMAKSISDPLSGIEGLIVRKNLIYMTSDFPEAGTIRLNIHSAPNSKIYNNVVSGGIMGLRFAESSFGEVKNNIFFNNRDSNSVDPETSSVDYNVYWGVDQGTPDQNGDNGTHSRFIDPQFLDAESYDFHLQPLSPAIDAGLSDGAPLADKEGNLRYDDPLTRDTGEGIYHYYDIGAFEYRPPMAGSPSGFLNGPYSEEEGKPVSFSSLGSYDPDGDELTYLWDFGDGQTSTEPNPSHAYSQNGVYSVTLTVFDGRGGQNSATQKVTVYANEGLSFDSQNDSVLVPYNSSLNISGAMTVEAFVKVRSFSGNHGVIASRWDGNTISWELYYENSGKLYFYVTKPDKSGYFQAITAPGVLTTGSWFHVAGVLNPVTDELSVYFNGRRVASRTYFETGAYASTARLGINAASNGTMVGEATMDEVRISNPARYTGSTYQVPTSIHNLDMNTVGLWHFNEAGGLKAYDFSSNQNNGNLMGDPLRVP